MCGRAYFLRTSEFLWQEGHTAHETEEEAVLQAAAAVGDELRAAGVRVGVDDRHEYRPGFKFNEWELEGVPLRIEIGGRDLAAGAVTVARRDTGEKKQIPLPHVAVAINEMLSYRSPTHSPPPTRTPTAQGDRRAPRPPAFRPNGRKSPSVSTAVPRAAHRLR